MKNFKLLPDGAYPFLDMDAQLFARQCRVDAYAASGPGGQKRNRTYSAVRITHLETGITVIAEESRSQTENRQRAFGRLKKALALNIRQDPSSAQAKPHKSVRHLFDGKNAPLINTKNTLYPIYCATVLDFLHTARGKVSDAARALQLSTGQLNKLLRRDRDLLHAANSLRQLFGLKPLKAS